VNTELYKHLDLIAQLTDLDGGGSFRVWAFRKVANAVRDADFEVTVENMSGLRGAGKSTQEVIQAFLETGTSPRLEDLCTRWPADVLTMTAVHGIGAKTAFQIYESTGIRNLDDLIAAAEKGGPEIGDRWLSAILLARDMREGRVPLGTAKNIALLITEALREVDGVRAIEVCGSIRRGKPTCKDIDIVVKAEPRDHARIHKAFSEMGKPLVSGETKTTIVAKGFGQAMQCDCWTVVPAEWGASVAYATGSKIHNMQLRALARKKGMKLNEKGIWRRHNMKRLGGEHERDIYDVLGIPYVEPEDREDAYKAA
jgi:DNA polymerase (family X)